MSCPFHLGHDSKIAFGKVHHGIYECFSEKELLKAAIDWKQKKNYVFICKHKHIGIYGNHHSQSSQMGNPLSLHLPLLLQHQSF